MEELINSQSDVAGRLVFKYMEMCKVDSSSDSESESSPRWAVKAALQKLLRNSSRTTSSVWIPTTEARKTLVLLLKAQGSKVSTPDTSPALHAAFSKRKLFPPSDDGMQRKRRCISDVELQSVAL